MSPKSQAIPAANRRSTPCNPVPSAGFVSARGVPFGCKRGCVEPVGRFERS